MSALATVQTLDGLCRSHDVPDADSVKVRDEGLLIVTTETGGIMYAPGQWVSVHVEDTCPA